MDDFAFARARSNAFSALLDQSNVWINVIYYKPVTIHFSMMRYVS